MAVTTQRKLKLTGTKRFGNDSTTEKVPDLTTLQTKSYADFLQADVAPEDRKNIGLEAVLRESFPIEDAYEKSSRLECQLRARKAALSARRVPTFAHHLWASVARSLPTC